MSSRQTVGAAVDLGSNSVHLLVAAVEGHELSSIVDESVFLGLGAAVDEHGSLGHAGRKTLADAIRGYAGAARRLGATSVTLLGTEPIRRAADGGRIVAEVEAASGAPLHVLTHEEEAYLTLVGVTEGRPVERETLVVDIGGGSSEFAAVAPGGLARAAGLRVGSNRLTTTFASSDPPTVPEVLAMRDAAIATMRGSLDATPRQVVAVGGTASNLLKVAPGGQADRVLTRERLEAALENLLRSRAAATSERYRVNPKRARILPAGAAIVDALMRRYGVDRVEISEASLREGAVLIAAHVGIGWRDRLPELAHGWRT